jgi:hypothetical protein
MAGVVKEFNALAAKTGRRQVKKFRNLATARQRLAALKAEAKTNGGKAKRTNGKENGAKAIVILKPEVQTRQTATEKRFGTLLKLRSKTVANYIAAVTRTGGGQKDLNWWAKRGRIRVG